MQNTPTENAAPDAGDARAPRLDARTARDWLRQEVEVRVPRLWLAIGGGLVLALALVALD